ncbi:MAG: alpha/beta fold hydrolase [Candidatus Omnitrophota bacterium]
MQALKTDPTTDIMFRMDGDLPAKAVLLLVHGLGAHSERWQFLTDFFQRRDIACYSIELKGFGETKTRLGHINSFKTYFNDIRSLYQIIKKENPQKKVFIAGESMGGLLAFLMGALEPRMFDGIICLAPAFASRLPVSFLKYVDIVVARFLFPLKRFTVRITPQMCTRDAEYQKIMEKDPREHRFASAKLLWEIARAEVHAVALAGKIIRPVLFLLPGQDSVVNMQASEHVFNFLPLKDKSMIHYEDMHHAMSVELGRERVFDDMYAWLIKRLK